MDLKEEIKNSIKLSEVIGKNLYLKKRDNNNYVALCPFHKEKTPSFNISDDKGFYHCFGCGKNGDIFNYLMDTENLSFVEALKKLADQAGINFGKQDNFVDSKITNYFKLLKRVSIIVIIFLKIKGKSLNNLLERILIEFSLSWVNIFTMPSQIRNEVRRVIKTLIIEEYFF